MIYEEATIYSCNKPNIMWTKILLMNQFKFMRIIWNLEFHWFLSCWRKIEDDLLNFTGLVALDMMHGASVFSYDI